MAQTHEISSLEESFEFSSGFKRKLAIAAIIGVALVAIGAFLRSKGLYIDQWPAEPGEAASGATLTSRIVANLWMNSMYFIGISLMGLFFIAYTYVAKGGWMVTIKRIAEAFPAFVIVPAIIMLVLYIIPSTRQIVFHWTHDGIMDPNSQIYDELIASKSWWLNFPFFLVRMVLYFVIWYFLWIKIRQHSILEDEYGGMDNYYTSRAYSKAFLIFFALTSTTAAWDLSMSIETHWFSTMYGWYHLSSWHVAGLSAMMLFILLLKERGHLTLVRMDTIHDLGKLIFGFAIFWTYLWFSQYLLIFYTHIPEETVYFWERFNGYGGRYATPMIASLVLIFVFPFLILMSRNSKRNFLLLKLGAVAILIGTYCDFYQMIMPGVAKDQGGFGFIEIGTTLVFASGFIYFVARELAKVNLYPVNHPALEESLHHEI